MNTSETNPFPPFEDVLYADVRPGDFVWDRSVSRWARVLETHERNAVEVELILYSGDSLVSECDTLIARLVHDRANGHWGGWGCACPTPTPRCIPCANGDHQGCDDTSCRCC